MKRLSEVTGKRCRSWMCCLAAVMALLCCRPPERKNEAVPAFVSGVYVTNEGNFQYGNASVSYRDERSGQVTSDVFFAANQSALGDVCQSMTTIGPYYYLVVNGSGKVEVLDTSTFRVAKTITGCSSPRYLLEVGPSKAYLSDYYDNRVHIVNLSTHSITGSISIPTWTEALAMAGGKVYVSAPHSRYVFVIDPAADRVVDSIDVGQGVNSMVEDKHHVLWLLSDGDLGAGTPFLAKADAVTAELIDRQELDHPAGSLSVTRDRSVLYWLEQGVVRLPVDSTVASRKKVVPKGSHTWYALGVHPFTEELYVSDVFDYLQNSKVFIFSKEGVEKSSFTTGVISGGFYFRTNY